MLPTAAVCGLSQTLPFLEFKGGASEPQVYMFSCPWAGDVRSRVQIRSLGEDFFKQHFKQIKFNLHTFVFFSANQV